MAILTKAEVLAASKQRKVQDVEIERLGGVARLTEMTTREMLDFRKETRDADEEEGALYLLARCWVDEEGARMFSGESAIEELGQLPLDVLNDLTTAVLEVNGMGEKAVEDAGKD